MAWCKNALLSWKIRVLPAIHASHFFNNCPSNWTVYTATIRLRFIKTASCRSPFPQPRNVTSSYQTIFLTHPIRQKSRRHLKILFTLTEFFFNLWPVRVLVRWNGWSTARLTRFAFQLWTNEREIWALVLRLDDDVFMTRKFYLDYGLSTFLPYFLTESNFYLSNRVNHSKNMIVLILFGNIISLGLLSKILHKWNTQERRTWQINLNLSKFS